MRRICVLAAIAALSVSSLSAAPKKAPKPGPRLVEVRTCPITGEKVKGNGSGSEVVGKYKVYFCCAGCQPALDKMNAKDKAAKVAVAAKKDATPSKT